MNLTINSFILYISNLTAQFVDTFLSLGLFQRGNMRKALEYSKKMVELGESLNHILTTPKRFSLSLISILYLEKNSMDFLCFSCSIPMFPLHS